jgi:hypothetical protein
MAKKSRAQSVARFAQFRCPHAAHTIASGPAKVNASPSAASFARSPNRLNRRLNA